MPFLLARVVGEYGVVWGGEEKLQVVPQARVHVCGHARLVKYPAWACSAGPLCGLEGYPAPAGYETAAVRMEVCAPRGYTAPAGYDKPPCRWTSARPVATPRTRKTAHQERAPVNGRQVAIEHRTCNTTHRAGTPLNRSQVAQDTAQTTRRTERAHPLNRSQVAQPTAQVTQRIERTHR